MEKVDSDRIIELMYNNEKRREKHLAKFRKCIFHLHSPVSYDYRLKKEISSWKQITDEELLSYAKKQGVIPIEYLKENIELDHITLSSIEEKIFESKKEALAFYMVAYELLKKEIAVVILTDHNTIDGFEKLNSAIQTIHNQFPTQFKIHTRVILGIEISCSDKSHVVGIFDSDNKKQRKKLTNWIEEYIMSEQDGTYVSSLQVLEDFNAIGGIGYIAHINTSTLLYDETNEDKKDRSTVSGGYKKKLFNLEFHTFFGVSNLEKAPGIQGKIKDIVNKTFYYIIDEDSHSLDEIGTKAFWIKGQTINFTMLYNALRDIPGTISYSLPQTPTSYIKSLYIDNKSFFKGNTPESGMLIPFSANMNALIGGRGTGKSTILNILEFLTSQLIENKKTLKYILKQGALCLLYCYQGKDYYIMFNSGAGNESDEIFLNDCFPEEDWKRHKQRLDLSEEKKLRKTIIRSRIQIFQVDETTQTFQVDKNIKTHEITSIQPILNSLFTRKFSIYNLVEIASYPHRTLNFLFDLVFSKLDITNGVKLNYKKRDWKTIEKIYKEKMKSLEKRFTQINDIILPFNEKQENKIKIKYRQNSLKESYFPWDKLLNIYEDQYDYSFQNYKISNYQLINLLNDLSLKSDPIDIILKIYHEDYTTLKKGIIIENYLMPDSFNNIESELKSIDENNIDFFLGQIKDTIQLNSTCVYYFLSDYFKNVDFFSLEFNINNRESTNELKPLFKPIDEISMGQKVVAMLSFILEYNNFIGDMSPLIIDQPEDNLDNQYIYRNLVQDFRSIKNTRQIIIATHNSTNVVNTGCENIIVLESDHKKSWISKKGYCKEKKINREIINNLEGGVEAFEQKINIYKDNLTIS